MAVNTPKLVLGILLALVSLSQVFSQISIHTLSDPTFVPNQPNPDFKIKSTSDSRNDVTLEWRLPRTIVPSHYEVEISPIIDEAVEDLGGQWDIPGKVVITVKAIESTQTIVLHSYKDVTIEEEKTEVSCKFSQKFLLLLAYLVQSKAKTSLNFLM